MSQPIQIFARDFAGGEVPVRFECRRLVENGVSFERAGLEFAGGEVGRGAAIIIRYLPSSRASAERLKVRLLEIGFKSVELRRIQEKQP